MSGHVTYHAFLTRFAVRLEGHSAPPSAEWVERRFTLFERYCLPSMQSQTLRDFEWLLFFDVGLPDSCAQRLSAYRDVCPDIVPVRLAGSWGGAEAAEAVRGRMPEGATLVVTSRLDSDDAVACDYVARLREAAATIEGGALFFDWGFNLVSGALYAQPLLRGPFASVIWRPATGAPFATVADHEHGRLDEVMPSVHLGLPHAWVQVVHGDNIANRMRGVRVPRSILRRRFRVPALTGLPREGRFELTADMGRSAVAFLSSLARDPERARRARRFVRERAGPRQAATPASRDEGPVDLAGGAAVTSRAPCPVCGATEVSGATPVRGVDGAAYSVGVCAGCGLRSVLDPPAATCLGAHYGGGYYSQQVLLRPPSSLRLKWWLEQRRSPLAARVLGALSIARLPAPGGLSRMLDVGCGDGAALVRAERLGWSPEGCEIDEAACAAVRARGYTCHAGEWWLSLPPGAYGLVHAHHVLEHLPDPAAALDGIRGAMAPGALLMIGLPNWECSMARAFGPAWWATKAPEHLWQFELRHVLRMLEQRRVTVDEVLCQNVLLATFRPSVLRAQWRSARGVGWGRVRVLSTLATAAAAGVVHRASRTGPAAGEGFACVLRCRAEAGGDVASP